MTPATGRSKYPASTTPGPEQIQRLQRTLDAARLLQSTLDLPGLTRIILEIVRNEVQVDRVTVFVIDRDGDRIHSLVAQGVNEYTLTMPMDKGLAGFVASTRQAVDIQDAYADPRFNPEFDRRLNYRTKDIFALPVLNNRGEAAGVLELLNRQKPITEPDREFLQDISGFIGVALESAWLHTEVRRKNELENALAQVRERLAQIARFSVMNEVLSTVAEKLTSPLGIVRNHAALLKEDRDLSPTGLRYADIIDRAAEAASEIVEGFRHFIDKPAGERSAVDITQLMRQIIRVRAANWASEGISAREDLRETPRVLANSAEIQQAVMNLIKNAEDAIASNAGPRLLTVRTEYDSFQDAVCIRIGDNGHGIAGQHYERIFEPFFSTRGGRTGLGLTIANRIAQEHQGQILFETDSNGTAFTMELPPARRS